MPLPQISKDPRDKGRKQKEVSDDIQKANIEPGAPKPKKKTEGEMQEDPAKDVTYDEVTGD